MLISLNEELKKVNIDCVLDEDIDYLYVFVDRGYNCCEVSVSAAGTYVVDDYISDGCVWSLDSMEMTITVIKQIMTVNKESLANARLSSLTLYNYPCESELA